MIAILMRLGLSSAMAGLVQYAAIGLAGLGFAAWIISGITAPYKDRIAALQATNGAIVKASEQKDILIADHARRVEHDADEDERLAAELRDYLNGLPAIGKPAACRFSSHELRFIKRLADR